MKYLNSKSFKKNTNKTAYSVVLGLAMVLGSGQSIAEVYIYNKTDSIKKQTESNVLYKTKSPKGFALGWNNFTKIDGESINTYAARIPMNEKLKIFLYSSKSENERTLEAKLTKKFEENLTVGMGIGDNDLYYGGFLNESSDGTMGFGASYITQDKESEIRGQAWKHWEKLGLFFGVRKSNNKILTIFGKPSNNGNFAVKFSNLTNLETDYSKNQLTIGIGARRSSDYYGMSLEHFKWQLKDKLLGNDSVNNEHNPLRRFPPNLSWIVKDFAIKLEREEIPVGFGNININKVEILKYLKDSNYWIGVEYNDIDLEFKNGQNMSGPSVKKLNFGYTSKNIQFSAGVGHGGKGIGPVGNLNFILKF